MGARVVLDPELDTVTGAVAGLPVQDGTDQDHGGTVTITDVLKFGDKDCMVVQDPFAVPKKCATQGLRSRISRQAA